MPFTIEDLGLGLFVPAVVAAAISIIVRAIPWREGGRRQAGALAFITATVVAYALVKLGPWQPKQSFEWLIYAIAAAAVCGPIVGKEQSNWYERGVLFLVVSVAATWVIVPTWSSLESTRMYWVIATTLTMVGVAGAIEFLAAKLDSWFVAAALSATALVAGMLNFLAGSGIFAQIAMAMSGALLGISLGSLWRKDDRPMRGVGLAFAVGVVGILMLGRVGSFTKIPTLSYGMIALAPAILAACLIPPLGRLRGAKAFVVQSLLVLLVLTSALIIAVVVDPTVIQTE